MAFICGQVIALTAPISAHLDVFIVGKFPTTDKYGSLAFYLDGVHHRLLTDPVGSLQDPAARLIGVHMGHLWVTEFFDLWMTPEGAVNLQALLYPMLAWGCAALLFREAGARLSWSILMAHPFAMGLHLFRDLNCYTIEKSAIFWLPLFTWSLLRTHRSGGLWSLLSGLIYVLMSWMNLYLGAVGAMLAALVCLPIWFGWLKNLPKGRWRPPPLVLALIACVLLSLPLLLWQHALSSGPDALGSPEAFKARAAADRLQLWPLEWNRLSWWRALSPLALLLIALGSTRLGREPLARCALIGVIGLTALAFGPEIGGLLNPIDWAAREGIPGFWRAAKPETFFQGSWLLLLGLGALGMSQIESPRWVLAGLYMAMIATWLVGVRSHGVYPSMFEKTEIYLAPDWAEQVFGSPEEGTK